MEYKVDLNAKTITYSDDLHENYIKALQKIFKPQGYTFYEEASNVEMNINQLIDIYKETGNMPTESYKMEMLTINDSINKFN